MLDKLTRVRPWVWVALLAVAGVGYLSWHRFTKNDDDTDWTTPKETQAPTMAELPLTKAQLGPCHGSGSPMSCNASFKPRSYADTLASLQSSIIGGF